MDNWAFDVLGGSCLVLAFAVLLQQVDLQVLRSRVNRLADKATAATVVARNAFFKRRR